MYAAILAGPRARSDSTWLVAQTSGIRLAAGFVFAASGRIVGLVDQDVVVAGGADHAVNRLAELLVARLGRVFLARLLPADRHRSLSLPVTPSTSANKRTA